MVLPSKRSAAAAVCAVLFSCPLWSGHAAQGQTPEEPTAACKTGGGGSESCPAEDGDVMSALQHRNGRVRSHGHAAQGDKEDALRAARSPCGLEPCGKSPIKPYRLTTYSCGPYKYRWSPSSEALVEPENVYSSKGQLLTSLVFHADTFRFEELGIKVTTRVYNGSLPGPTLNVKRGDLLRMNLINALEPNNYTRLPFPIPMREGQVGVSKDDLLYQDVGQSPENKTLMIPHVNNFHNVNDTNFHTHGWHVSPNLPQDNIIKPNVRPGQNFTYFYQLSPYHQSGSSWYHNHRHGTTEIQAAGGGAGALIVQNEPGEIASWIEEITPKVLVLTEQAFQYVGPDAETMAPGDPFQGCYPLGTSYVTRCALQHRTELIAGQSGDRLFKVEQLPGVGCGSGELPPIRHWIATNGQYAPYIDLKPGEWTRLRFIYAGHSATLNLIFGEDSQDCEFQLVAKDTVFLPVYPRKLSKGIFFGPGNRCQVLVRCSKPGQKVIRNNWEVEQAVEELPDPFRDQPVLYLNVEKPSAPCESWCRYTPLPWRCYDYTSCRGCPGCVGNSECDSSCHAKPLPARCNDYGSCGGCPGCYDTAGKLEAVKQSKSEFPRYLSNLVDLPDSALARAEVANQYREEFITKGLLLDGGLTFNQKQIYDFPNGPPPMSPVNITLDGHTVSKPGAPNWEAGAIEYPVRFTINNQTYEEPKNSQPPSLDIGFQARVPVGEALQFNVSGLQLHSWHMHTNPVQIVKFGKEDYKEFWGGYFEIGDWQDTLLLPIEGLSPLVATPETSLVVRWLSDCYNGVGIIHCHVLYHEDLGMFTQINIEGPNYTPARFPNRGIFKYPPPQCMEMDSQCPVPVCTDYVYPTNWVNTNPTPDQPTQDYQYAKKAQRV